MSEVTKPSSEHFLLIKDFRLSLQKSHFRIDRLEDSDDIIAVAQEMREALNQCTNQLDTIDIAEIWNSMREFVSLDEDFIVSLDGDFVLRNPDSVIEMTRAARSIAEAESGKFLRISRSIGSGVLSQVKRIENQYLSQEKKRIVLFDDGLGTGNTVRRIIELFHAEGMNVDRVVVLANPSQYDAILDVPVHSVFEVSKDSVWLNERDLFWGLPRSGVSLIPRGLNIGLGGVPYTSSKTLISNRIGLSLEFADSFSQNALLVNERFWQIIDHAHARNFPFRDCPRLAVFAEESGIDLDKSISQHIGELARQC